MSIISQTTWDKFTQEEKEKVIEVFRMATKNNAQGKVAEIYEGIFPEEALHPKPLTYEDVTEELFDGEDTFYISDIGSIVLAEGGRLIYDKYKLPNNCTSRKQAEKLLAINRLLNVAKFLNKDWKPDWENNEEPKWYLCDFPSKRPIPAFTAQNNSCIVYFRTQQLAQQAIQILGEDTVRLALGNY